VLLGLDRLKRTALDLLFPQWCLGCGREGELICPSCRSTLPKIVPPICPLCGIPQSSGMLCPSCISWQQAIDGIRSPFRFEAVIRQAIHQLKYSNLRAITGALAELLSDYLTVQPVPGEVLIPVPLHRKRLRERGYNQSQLLAMELGRLVKLPVVADCLTRQRHSPPQARTASVSQRWSNVAAAFICRDHRLKAKQVIIIDDVTTSGATLDACAAALKTAGASSVWGLTLAREI
jgi:ComF family protein